jgi:hypothetical protein
MAERLEASQEEICSMELVCRMLDPTDRTACGLDSFVS